MHERFRGSYVLGTHTLGDILASHFLCPHILISRALCVRRELISENNNKSNNGILVDNNAWICKNLFFGNLDFGILVRYYSVVGGERIADVFSAFSLCFCAINLRVFWGRRWQPASQTEWFLLANIFGRVIKPWEYEKWHFARGHESLRSWPKKSPSFANLLFTSGVAKYFPCTFRAKRLRFLDEIKSDFREKIVIFRLLSAKPKS